MDAYFERVYGMRGYFWRIYGMMAYVWSKMSHSIIVFKTFYKYFFQTMIDCNTTSKLVVPIIILYYLIGKNEKTTCGYPLGQIVTAAEKNCNLLLLSSESLNNLNGNF